MGYRLSLSFRALILGSMDVYLLMREIVRSAQFNEITTSVNTPRINFAE
jgi:hypothetical protein